MNTYHLAARPARPARPISLYRKHVVVGWSLAIGVACTTITAALLSGGYDRGVQAGYTLGVYDGAVAQFTHDVQEFIDLQNEHASEIADLNFELSIVEARAAECGDWLDYTGE